MRTSTSPGPGATGWPSPGSATPAVSAATASAVGRPCASSRRTPATRGVGYGAVTSPNPSGLRPRSSHHWLAGALDGELGGGVLSCSVEPDQVGFLGGAEFGRLTPESAFGPGDLHTLAGAHPDQV